MTTLENRTHDPDMAGALRGALAIVLIGAALGIGYNAMGLASRPHRGLAWIKQPEKVESLEALQTAPGAAASAGSESHSAGGKEDATSATGPGDAQAATATAPPEPSKATPAAEAKHDTSSASAPAHASKAAPKKAGTTSGSKAPATATKKGATASGSQGSAAGTKSAASQASAAAPGAPAAGATAATSATGAASGAAPPAGAPTGAATTPAAADLPVIPDVTGPLKLELPTLKKLYAANAALIIDAREAEEYTDGHIKGATSLPYNDAMAEPDKVKKLDPAGRPIVIYCSGGDCELSMDLAKLMVENGKRKVLVYEGGFPEWQGAGMPVTKGANP